MKKSLLTILSVCFSLLAIAQIPACEKASQLLEKQYQVESEQDVLYSTNINYQGQEQDLLMDVYYPTDDSDEPRPLVILAHGGFFLGGDKADMSAECNYLAERGYVAVTIQYTLWRDFSIPDSLEFASIVMRSVNDMKTAVRFFKQDAAEQGNTYNIDTNAITLGGYSAGSFVGLHTAAIEPTDDLPQFIADSIEALGGFSRVGEYSDYEASVDAVLDIAGALYRADFAQGNMPPTLSLHGDEDNTVPYKRGDVRDPLFGGKIITVEGSFEIQQVIQEEGQMGSKLITIEGGGHDYPWASLGLADSSEIWITEWLADRYCPEIASGTQNISAQFEVYPNPAQDILFVSSEMNHLNARILSIDGKQIQSDVIQNKQINIQNLESGTYFIQIGKQVQSFIKN